MELSRTPRWTIAPYFVVDDVVSTANYYRDALGFHYDRLWNDPASFCIVERNGAAIMLAQFEPHGLGRPNHIADPEGGAWDAYVWTDNVDVLNRQFKANGVKIVRDVSISRMAVATSTSKTATATASALASWSQSADRQRGLTARGVLTPKTSLNQNDGGYLGRTMSGRPGNVETLTLNRS